MNLVCFYISYLSHCWRKFPTFTIERKKALIGPCFQKVQFISDWLHRGKSWQRDVSHTMVARKQSTEQCQRGGGQEPDLACNIMPPKYPKVCLSSLLGISQQTRTCWESSLSHSTHLTWHWNISVNYIQSPSKHQVMMIPDMTQLSYVKLEMQ